MTFFAIILAALALASPAVAAPGPDAAPGARCHAIVLRGHYEPQITLTIAGASVAYVYVIDRHQPRRACR